MSELTSVKNPQQQRPASRRAGGSTSPGSSAPGHPHCGAAPGDRHRCTCEQADGPGQPVHNPLNAWRAKTRPAGAEDADPQAGRAPVTEAVRTAGNTLDRAEQLAAALRETAEHLAEALATAD